MPFPSEITVAYALDSYRWLIEVGGEDSGKSVVTASSPALHGAVRRGEVGPFASEEEYFEAFTKLADMVLKLA